MIFFLYEIFDINILQYVTFRAAAAAITALMISFLLGPKIIRTLQNRQIGESIREKWAYVTLPERGYSNNGRDNYYFINYPSHYSMVSL